MKEIIDIKKLTPLSFARRTIDAAVGDEMFNIDHNRRFIVQAYQVDDLNDLNYDVGHLFVVSFNFRKNKGTKPTSLSSNLLILTRWKDGKHPDEPSRAGSYTWQLESCLLSWKPCNKALHTEYLNNYSSPTDPIKESVIYLEESLVPDLPPELDYTIEQSINDEVPPTGLLVQFRRLYEEDYEYYNGYVVCNKGDMLWCHDDKYGDKLYKRDQIQFRPIMFTPQLGEICKILDATVSGMGYQNGVVNYRGTKFTVYTLSSNTILEIVVHNADVSFEQYKEGVSYGK